jgi:FkbM family methyltransferase
MKSIFRYFKGFVLIALSKMPSNSLEAIEKLFQEANGKGFGTSSIELEVKLFQKELNSLNITKPILIDLGGNIGLWSLEFKRVYPESEIHILEPSSAAFKKLTANIKHQKHITIHNLAVDVENGTRLLHSDQPGSGMASFYERNLNHFGIEIKNAEPVECIKIDDFIEQNGISPNCLKIDIEGHELSILRSVISIRQKFRVILFEFGGCNIDSHTYFQEFWYFFEANNYKLFRVTPSGPKEVKSYNESLETFRTTNYIAVAQD